MKERYSTIGLGSVPPDAIDENDSIVMLGFIDTEAAVKLGATPGNVETLPVWRIQRMAKEGTVTRRTFPRGSTLHAFAWDRRNSYEYAYEGMTHAGENEEEQQPTT